MTGRASLNAGSTVAGRYVLERCLGTGSTRELWLANDTEASRLVVLKRLQAAGSSGVRPEHETARVESLSHPAIVKCFGLVREDEATWLVQEHMGGGDSRRLRGRGWRESVPAMLAVVDALEHVHAVGLVHLDLNPGNVLLDDSGHWRLSDFGAAAAIGAEEAPGGSPYARSPGRWLGAPADPSDDLYGLGALAYEWLVGHPPFYPDISAGLVLHAVPEFPISPSGVLPPELASLVMGLLNRSAPLRPSLQSVRRCLMALNQPTDALAEPTSGSPLLPPVLLVPPTDDPEAGADARKLPDAEASPAQGAGWMQRSDWGTRVAFALALVAAIAVLFWKPDPLPVPKPPSGNPAVRMAGARSESRRTAPQVPAIDAQELTRLAARKSAADVRREEFRRERDALARLPVAAWAESAWGRAQSADKRAMERYDGMEFEAAGEAWQEGLQQIREIAAARGPALANALASGRAALGRADAPAARSAFERALAISPGHKAAVDGLRRAGSVDEVTRLLDEARLHEQSGRLAEAGVAYRRVLQLDSSVAAASAGLIRVQSAGDEALWRSTLAQAWRQLGAGQSTLARQSFERAGKMRPGAPEVVEGLAQLDGRDRSVRLASLRTRAGAAEQAERWSEANALYGEALGLEPGVSFATDGRERASARLRLDQALQSVLENPKQALRSTFREMARVWLSEAAQQPGPRARLQRQIQGVQEILAAAERPLRLEVASDGQTQVTVLRVRRLGAITRESVEVLPGTVVLIGTRPGYRDVRLEVQVSPDVSPAPVSVRCEERI